MTAPRALHGTYTAHTPQHTDAEFPAQGDTSARQRGTAPPYHHHIEASPADLDIIGRTFWSRVDRSATAVDACWPWIGSLGGGGYGQFDRRVNGRRIHTSAHRIALCLKLGRCLRPDEVSRHLCHNRLCCRPEHLVEGTQSENMMDSVRDRTAFVGELNGMATLSDAVVIELREMASKGRRRGWMKEQAERLGLHPAAIARAISGVYYAHLPAPAGPLYKLRNGDECGRGHSLVVEGGLDKYGNCRPCRNEAQRRFRQRAAALVSASPEVHS